MTIAPDMATGEVWVDTWRGDQAERHIDVLAVEEPLEIRLAGWSVAVTMRTPGDDLDLAAGFLYTEGILRGREDIATINHCADERGETANVVNINPTDPTIVDPARWQRHFYATSSCGICGKASIEAVRRELPPIASNLRLTPALLYRMECELRAAQAVFWQTGGVHAAALFDADGQRRVAREDVGRHNAVDKVIGAMVRAGGVPLAGSILVVSSRASFEIVQKALAAGIPVVATVSAASSLAVDLARAGGLTLIGFLRPDRRFNVYAGAERVSHNE